MIKSLKGRQQKRKFPLSFVQENVTNDDCPFYFRVFRVKSSDTGMRYSGVRNRLFHDKPVDQPL